MDTYNATHWQQEKESVQREIDAYNAWNNQRAPLASDLHHLTIFIETREWFDSLNGNSYFSIVVQVNRETVGHSNFEYGYSESARLACALHILQEANIFPKSRLRINGMDADYNKFYEDKVNKKHTFYIAHTEVTRKKHLHNGGKGA